MWQTYGHQPRRTPPGDGGRVPRWIPPPAGVMKINVDAAVSKNTGLGAVAAVARNAEGVFCGASTVVLPGKTDAETLEALACREALSLAQDINTRRIRVASDCLNVVRSMNQGTMGVYAHVVREFKETARELDEVTASLRLRLCSGSCGLRNWRGGFDPHWRWDGRRPRCVTQSTGDAQDGKARLAQARLLPCRETTTATMRSRTSIPMFPRPSATFSSNSIA
ncbi:hypothetical protein QYE76_054544 [Lolium multiflorum]|uniref:RNase H type-1 domain-containing protein n=1 Tax=Lolium multiflorum TaxID=4521 RepID=A0AAD8WNL3_LOLMU|nr:hypothetical protein QYE76_054544 [Lolium multiflorum]